MKMAEDYNRLKIIARRLRETHFREPWQFRISVEGYPYDDDDFDLYVKEISYGPTEIETEAEQIGVKVLTFPSSAQPVTLSMTMRDHQDRRVSKWFNERVKKVVNDDGTVNLPADYVLKMRRFSLLEDNSEEETDLWEVVPTQLGDVTEERDGEGTLEFPITFIQFRS